MTATISRYCRSQPFRGEQVTCPVEPLQPGVGEQAGQDLGVAGVNDLVGGALHDQGGLGDAALPAQRVEQHPGLGLGAPGML
jgi:hypothetical protein